MKITKNKDSKFLNEYYYKTEKKSNDDIEVFVCEDTCYLHFINMKTNKTIHIITNTNY